MSVFYFEIYNYCIIAVIIKLRFIFYLVTFIQMFLYISHLPLFLCVFPYNF